MYLKNIIRPEACFWFLMIFYTFILYIHNTSWIFCTFQCCFNISLGLPMLCWSKLDCQVWENFMFAEQACANCLGVPGFAFKTAVFSNALVSCRIGPKYYHFLLYCRCNRCKACGGIILNRFQSGKTLHQVILYI